MKNSGLDGHVSEIPTMKTLGDVKKEKNVNAAPVVSNGQQGRDCAFQSMYRRQSRVKVVMPFHTGKHLGRPKAFYPENWNEVYGK